MRLFAAHVMGMGGGCMLEQDREWHASCCEDDDWQEIGDR